MPAYRIRHIPTGLFYRPSSEVRAPGWKWGYVKTNLSKTGKVYARRPSLAHIGRNYYNHTLIARQKGEISPWNKPTTLCLPFIEAEWVIEEF